MSKPYWRVLAILLVVAACTGCSSSDDGDNESTPVVPTVLSVTPADGAIHVEPWQEIQVEFSVAMDEASVEAATTLTDPTRGLVAFETAWLGQILVIDPDEDLEHGLVYTLTIGVSAESDAGEPLAAAFTSSFTTLPNYPVVLTTYPADGATDVALNADVHLEFSMSMDYTSTVAAIDIDPAAGYDVNFNGDDLTLDFVSNLAASTTYTVTIDETAAADGPGPTLAEDYVFSFTTGSGVDNTPPTIVSYSPANGASGVSVNIGELVITFSEPIRDMIEPEGLDLRLDNLVYAEPTLDATGTVFTVPLLRLPPGCELWVDLGPFQDAVGNWSANPPRYSFTTAGTADFFPAGVNDWWESVQVGDFWENYYLHRVENKTGDDFDISRYVEPSPPPGRSPDDYTELDQISHYSRTSSVLYWDGNNEHENDIWYGFTFAPPVQWLLFPLNLGRTWEGQSTFERDGEDARVTYSAEVTDILDFAPDFGRGERRGAWSPAGGRQGGFVFPDCAEVTLSFELEAFVGGEWQLTEIGSEVSVYCPGLGRVYMHGEGTEYTEGGPESWVEDAYLIDWLVGQ